MLPGCCGAETWCFQKGAWLVVLPITSKNRGQPIHLPVKPPEGGLSMLSFIKCEDIRPVSKQRLKQFRGTVSAETMAEVENRIRILLNL